MPALITAPGIYPGITAKEYHADPCASPSLNSSIAKILVKQSPRHAWLAHPRLGGAPVDGEEKEEKVSKQKLLGSAIHRLMLGKGGDIVVCDFKDWRKDAAKEARALALANGNIPMLPHDHEDATTIAKEFRKQLDDLGLQRVFREGINEVVIVWKEGETYLRAMLDNLIINEESLTAEIWDLKTVGRSSHPDACAVQINSMGYDLSASFYKAGLQAVRPDLRKTEFRWAFGEVAAPYAVTPVEIDGMWQTSTFQHYCNASDAWMRCMKEDKWPFYVNGIARLEARPWMLAAALSAEIAGNQ